MKLSAFPFQTIDWTTVPKEEYQGETGTATWQVKMMNDIRVRLVEYSPGYKADHWCRKGHIIFCLAGEMTSLLFDGRQMQLKAGMCYFVGDECEAHQSSTELGCKLFIVD